MDDAIFLNSIYKGRYPTEDGLLPHGEPSRKDTEQAISAAKKLIEKLSDIQTSEEVNELRIIYTIEIGD
ncbi:MAG: hypothetical protein JETT_3880 [Candidatus Jettenia ecosi]|uniref:HEPN domain-containing protein n=1 Tax=Candidatus Jettenia ecosi TaxID=2494326 RepID=A0A533Q5N7_9BACT|nr:MAG: hypothetical protein JETT_3880 [Candidatus Jettenia ecosi]